MLTFSATNFSHLKWGMDISHYIDSQQRTIKNLDHEGKMTAMTVFFACTWNDMDTFGVFQEQRKNISPSTETCHHLLQAFHKP